MTARRAALLAGGLLFLVYVATLAPGVTFWDAGEFIAAARVLGIPHPPGTPLFVVALNAWARVVPFLPFATATNLFSALCSATAVAVTALWVARATRSPWMGAAAGITAGAMTTVWQNATETEVYAASLVVSVGAVAAADLAGRNSDRRWLVLAAYLLALAVPLHLSVLVASPVAVLLATRRDDDRWDWPAGVALLGVTVCAAGIGRLSAPLVVSGVVLVLAAAVVHRLPVLRERSTPVLDWRTHIAVLASLAAAFSGLVILYLRARHDPAVNQANPSTLEQMAYVVGRRQYDLAGLWPRQAPLWLQLANWFEYADWQFALSFAPTVIPTVWRVLATLVFAALGVVGARAHRVIDRRTWSAVAMLLACGTLGVIVYLNLKAGASFAWSIVPDGAHHEARDRDYFFVLGFWAWGIWAGMGAMVVAARLRWRAAAGVALAALPIALNWRAVNRRTEPEASLPAMVARTLLDPLPPRSVLFVAGDNDSYPLWYSQRVEGRRRDVTVVTMPLLGARWYGEELERRERLLDSGFSGGVAALSASIARHAEAAGRPVAVAVTVPAADRNRIGLNWTVVGSAYLASRRPPTIDGRSWAAGVTVDSAATSALALGIARWKSGRAIHPSLDPVHEYFWGVLSCPGSLLQAPSTAHLASLDSLCNLR